MKTLTHPYKMVSLLVVLSSFASSFHPSTHSIRNRLPQGRSLGRRPIVLYSSNNDKEEDELAAAFESCREATEIGSRTFYLATQFMDRRKAEAVWAIYTWCRETDEVADGEEGGTDEERATELEFRRQRLQKTMVETSTDGASSADVALAASCRRFQLEVSPFEDMIDGMLMDLDLGDQSGPSSVRVMCDSIDEQDLYAYRVAGTVGLMTLPIVGEGVDTASKLIRQRAVALGEAFQLTNILRDVGEDIQLRNRVYIPGSQLTQFGVAPEDILKMSTGEVPISDAYRRLIASELERNLARYEVAEQGIPMLPWITQFPVRVALELYREIAMSVRSRNGYDNLTQRAFVGKWSKIGLLPGIAVRAAIASWQA
eukprot:CAMPEP_0185763098 /NCGR_PEP_ID=MMETSP1174-20130828/22049_1 /TAXON_ID=35687 /ORGANISM="Dictyocha speculum, Strain CCMP1381" /LENGTH=370 /DNA_ID=CAMNT_0028445069 /DNA_START=12 /DNA_END=1124 /DNA_ORIENTATION=-